PLRAAVRVAAAMTRALLAVVWIAGVAAAEPCPDADTYERALAAHRERSIELCRDPRAAACVDEKATIDAIGAKLKACLAGTAVGPPSSELPPALTPTRAPRPAVVGFIEGVVGGGIALGNAQWPQA